ncbi:MAG: beta-ketoacyl-[acyl-carrier-protein] synthase family protein [bacterium]|nr:beta-ketoacyl-[acyl-carrier-protein] synthase family protein [bacterium]
MTKVLITGAGVNSPLGCSTAEFMKNLRDKTYGIDHIANFDTDFFPADFGAEVRENEEIIKTGLETDRKALFINHAVEELVADSPDFENYPPGKRMIHMGTGIDYFNLVGYVNSEDSRHGQWENFYQRSNKVVDDLAARHNIRGGSSANVAACVASTQAMGLSFRVLKRSPGMTVITGGFDSMLCHLHYMGFYKLGALAGGDGDARHACKPFDKNRGGLVLGEGGVAFLLQREEDIEENEILAEICGYSSTMDAYKVTDPHPEGKQLARAAFKAIEEAGITPDHIDCVHLHGTGTFKNALAETRAMESVFPRRFKEIPVFSLKAQIGHLIGACGAMEMLGVIYSLRHQVVPPTLNFREPDPEVPLNVVKDEPLPLIIKNILKLNSGFGGQNTALVVKKYDN